MVLTERSREHASECDTEKIFLKLSAQYRKIHEEKKEKPEWAVHKKAVLHEPVHCSVPFIGKRYSQEPVKLLLYASAENLTGYDGYLDDDEIAINRHRRWFDENADGGSFFPDVHIAPIDDGSLATAAFYIYLRILEKAEGKSPLNSEADVWKTERPADFYEKICFGNYSKYTVYADKNIDPAGDQKLLKESQEYIEADTELLRPDFIIMPKKIYETEREFIDGIKGNAKIIPVYQINATTINTIIAKKYPVPADKKSDKIREAAALWYENLGKNKISGKTRENFRSVFEYLDDLLKYTV